MNDTRGLIRRTLRAPDYLVGQGSPSATMAVQAGATLASLYQYYRGEKTVTRFNESGPVEIDRHRHKCRSNPTTLDTSPKRDRLRAGWTNVRLAERRWIGPRKAGAAAACGRLESQLKRLC